MLAGHMVNLVDVTGAVSTALTSFMAEQGRVNRETNGRVSDLEAGAARQGEFKFNGQVQGGLSGVEAGVDAQREDSRRTGAAVSGLVAEARRTDGRVAGLEDHRDAQIFTDRRTNGGISRVDRRVSDLEGRRGQDVDQAG